MDIKDIDNMLDIILDKFMYEWVIEKNKNFINYEKVIKTQNIEKYQNELNELLEYSENLVSQEEIDKIVSKNSNAIIIKNTMLKYIAYYAYILIGLNYEEKNENFNASLVEINNNQSKYSVKLDDFFNSESNSNIIKIIFILKELLGENENGNENGNENETETKNKTDNKTKNKIKDKPNKTKNKNKNENTENENANVTVENTKTYTKETQNFIDKIGNSKMDMLLKQYKKNKIIVCHNSIKIAIFVLLFSGEEKKHIFNIIDESETMDGEFIFIDIVVPKHLFIDFDKIKEILEPEQIETEIPIMIYDMLNINYNDVIYEKKRKHIDIDGKIQKLFESKLIVPITDDFLLYHKNNEKYEYQGEEAKKKENTKIKYIVNKINTISDYYKDPENIKKLFYTPLINKYATLVNKYENLKIYNKMTMTSLSNQNLDLFNEFNSFMSYPNIPFRHLNNHYFSHVNFGETYDIIRNSSLIFKKYNKTVETRILSYGMITNIMGFAILGGSDIDKITPNDFINIDIDATLKNVKDAMNEKINNTLHGKYTDKNYIFVFDKTKKYFLKGYDENISQNDIVKLIMSYLYDYYLEESIQALHDYVKNNKSKTLVEYKQMFENFQLKLPDVLDDQFSAKIVELEHLMYDIKSLKTDDIEDIEEKTFSGLYDKVYKLPTYIKKDISSVAKIVCKPKMFCQPNTMCVHEKHTNKIISKTINNINNDLNDNKLNNDKLNDDKLNSNNSNNKSVGNYFNGSNNRNNDDDNYIEDEEKEEISNLYVDGVCQHYLSWDKIIELKKKKSALYSVLIYEYIQQFVTMNEKQYYICKSCKSMLPIEETIQDGHFDSKLQKFIPHSYNLDIELEKINEYEPYKLAIKSIDKIIERISIILHLPLLIGSTYGPRNRRKIIVKDTIDLLLHNNTFIEKEYQLIKNEKRQIFGIDKLSMLFNFELKSDIFIYSSEDKDIYKIKKYNNSLAYIIILMILELDEKQIIHLAENQKNNLSVYEFYKKIFTHLFERFNIIINKQQETEPITKYPVLCYLLYMISYYVIGYNLWSGIPQEELTKNEETKQRIIYQKMVINTVIELLNVILLVNINTMKEKRVYLYQTLHFKYYAKIQIYNNKNVMKKIDKEMMETKTIQKYDITISNKYDIVPTTNTVENDFVVDNLYKNIVSANTFKRLTFTKPKPEHTIIKSITNLTNCPNGEFHNFSACPPETWEKCKKEFKDGCCKNATEYNGDFTCKICSVTTDLKKLKIKESDKLIENYSLLKLKGLAFKYGIDGHIHNFNQEKICNICGYVKDSDINFTDKELYKMFENIEKIKKEKSLHIEQYISNLDKESTDEIMRIKKIFDKLMYKFQKVKDDILLSINNLLDIIQKSIGMEFVINKNTYNLHKNIYIINHNFNGSLLETPIKIYEDNVDMKYVENHSHFKHDVIVYTMYKKTKYELFYDINTKYLIGYRELNKKIITHEKTNAKLQINYSVKNMLNMFGFARENMSIKDYYPHFYGMDEEQYKNTIHDKDIFTMNNFANKITLKRFENIKTLGKELHKFYNRLKYNYKIDLIMKKDVNEVVADEVENNALDIIYDKYKKKFSSNNLDNHYEHDFLKYMNLINVYLVTDTNTQKIQFNEYLNYTFIVKHNFINNMVLNYIIDEINRLIENNTNKVVKTNVVNFVLEILINLFDSFNFDISKYDSELSILHQVLYTTSSYIEITESITNEPVDIYDEPNVPIAEMTDEQKQAYQDDKYDDDALKEGYDMEDGPDEELEGYFEDNDNL